MEFIHLQKVNKAMVTSLCFTICPHCNLRSTDREKEPTARFSEFEPERGSAAIHHESEQSPIPKMLKEEGYETYHECHSKKGVGKQGLLLTMLSFLLF